MRAKYFRVKSTFTMFVLAVHICRHKLPMRNTLYLMSLIIAEIIVRLLMDRIVDHHYIKIRSDEHLNLFL